MNLKKLGKNLVCYLLEQQVRRLRQKHDFQIITVAGSVGKTSTKLAIAQTLGASRRVIFQDGNYNDRLTVPLVLFGQEEPDIFDISAWLKLLWQNEKQLRADYPYEVAVLELGTDAPGQMRKFAYLKPDVAVLTAIGAEHMEYFGTLDAVAEEELLSLAPAKQRLLNLDDVPVAFLPSVPFLSYGLSERANYHLTDHQKRGLQGQVLTVDMNGKTTLKASIPSLGAQGAKLTLAAMAVAQLIGCSDREIEQGLERIAPAAGRMQVLAGKHDSILLDDTYNASPMAVKAALEVLSVAEATQRIAILGSMNELGESSAAEHRAVGEVIDPKKITQVVTIGAEAAKYLAPAAEAAGCTVTTFKSPYEAGKFVEEKLQPGTVVLGKGSQNGVFAEEALKQLLANPDDAAKLVRQSPHWLAVKRRQFPH